MKIRFSGILLIFAAFIMAGCSSMSGFPERSENKKNRIENLAEHYISSEDERHGKKESEEEVDDNNDEKTNIFQLYEAAEGDKKKEYRNEIILNRMRIIDLQFSIFREAIYEEGVGSNLVVDILGVSVGAAGTAFTGATASRIMSALSAGIAGTGTAINENLYFKQTMPALMALMEAEREKIKAQIYQNLEKDAADYPIDMGLLDIERYFFAGSIPGAIGSITKTAGVEKDKAEKKLASVQERLAIQSRLDKMLDSVNSLPIGKAWDILQAPPEPLAPSVEKLVNLRLGGRSLTEAANDLAPVEDDEEKNKANDANAKSVLKMILVHKGTARTEETLANWEAAIKAQQ